MSALPPKADMCGALRRVCYGPKADISSAHNPDMTIHCGLTACHSALVDRLVLPTIKG